MTDAIQITDMDATPHDGTPPMGLALTSSGHDLANPPGPPAGGTSIGWPAKQRRLCTFRAPARWERARAPSWIPPA